MDGKMKKLFTILLMCLLFLTIINTNLLGYTPSLNSTYDLVSYVPRVQITDIGTGSLGDYGYSDHTVTLLKKSVSIGSNEYEEKPDRFLMVNEFETTINIPIEVHSNFLYLTSGSTLTYDVLYESYNIETVEEESLEQFSISLEANANAMGNYNGISFTMSVTPEVNYFVENIKTHSYMLSLRETVSYSISYPIQDTAL